MLQPTRSVYSASRRSLLPIGLHNLLDFGTDFIFCGRIGEDQILTAVLVADFRNVLVIRDHLGADARFAILAGLFPVRAGVCSLVAKSVMEYHCQTLPSFSSRSRDGHSSE